LGTSPCFLQPLSLSDNSPFLRGATISKGKKALKLKSSHPLKGGKAEGWGGLRKRIYN